VFKEETRECQPDSCILQQDLVDGFCEVQSATTTEHRKKTHLSLLRAKKLEILITDIEDGTVAFVRLLKFSQRYG
jgi:hypothetical protein